MSENIPKQYLTLIQVRELGPETQQEYIKQRISDYFEQSVSHGPWIGGSGGFLYRCLDETGADEYYAEVTTNNFTRYGVANRSDFARALNMREEARGAVCRPGYSIDYEIEAAERMIRLANSALHRTIRDWDYYPNFGVDPRYDNYDNYDYS